jgi:hypothetical protein
LDSPRYYTALTDECKISKAYVFIWFTLNKTFLLRINGLNSAADERYSLILIHTHTHTHTHTYIYIYIFDKFVNCNWVDTRWQ